MPLHFQWLLTCPDNNTSFTLTKDPANWADCSYRLERHPVYMGIFNQFTSSLKFHAEGGGKQFVDGIYKQYDIDGNVFLQVNIDRTGTGQYYDTLFNGRLNLASYSNDGTFTTVNVEANDTVYKLNTRAGIPVPVNVLSIPAGYYNPADDGGNWVAYSFFGVQLDSYDPSDYPDGPGPITDTLAVQGYTYYAQTLDENFNPVTAQCIFDGNTNPNNGTQTGPNGDLPSLTLSVIAGVLNLTFSGATTPVILYRQGSQLSLGQQPITPVPVKNVSMPGIPILYESTFSLADEALSGTNVSINLPNSAGVPFQIGAVISACVEDANGYNIYDQITYTGTSQAGPGMTSTNGLSNIKITGCTANTLTITYTNAYGPITIWAGTPGTVNTASPNGGTPPGVNLYTYSPPGGGAPSQQFTNPPNPANGGIAITEGLVYQGFIGFDAITLFDNLNDFAWGTFNDLRTAPQNTQTTQLPAICTGIGGAYIEEPVKVDYSITLKGTLTEAVEVFGNTSSQVSVQRRFTVSLVLAYGGGNATGATSPLAAATKLTLATGTINTVASTFQWNFDIEADSTPNAKGTFNLEVGDSVWFYAFIQEQFLEGAPNADETFIIPLNFSFAKSLIDFQVTIVAEPTTAETIMVHEAFNQVVDMLCDSDGNFYSEFYGRTNSQKHSYAQNGAGSLRALTNGLCIRGHTDKPILLSLNALFSSLAAIDNIGLSIDANNRVRVEPIEFFFNPNALIATLPFVNVFETTNENSYYLNQIEVGYDQWETEIYFKNGLDEIHASRNYGTRIGAAKGTILQNYQQNASAFLRIANKLSAISKFIAGNYTIELTREKNLAWSHDDFKYDNNNFILCMNNVYRAGEGQVIFVTGNTVTLYLNDIPIIYDLLPGDTFTVSGTSSNNGAYTISEIIVSGPVLNIPAAASITIHVNESFITENSTTAVLTFTNSIFLEFAKDVLQQPLTNVISPALSQMWLNMSITPARMLQAQMNRITAGLQTINGKLQFLGGTGNFQAASQLFATGSQQDYNGKILYENAVLNWNDANARNITPLWLPEVYKFQYPLTYQQFKAIAANPNGYINFYKFANDVKQGFILSMEYNLKNGMTQFELLKMYNPNADKLILTEGGEVVSTESTVLIGV